MVESLLSFSNISLFGQLIGDLQIVSLETRKKVRAATTEELATLGGHTQIDGVPLKKGNLILVWKQSTTPTQNGIYKVKADMSWGTVSIDVGDKFVTPNRAVTYRKRVFQYTAQNTFTLLDESGWKSSRVGNNRDLEEQLEDASFARIYGFSFEGAYYDLPRPVLFLVHGDGDIVNLETGQNTANPHLFRAPGSTSLTGIGAANFDFADNLRVWSYDKGDYTIRMDVETGMFEDVLLAAMLGGGPGGMDSAGMNARGMNARGMNARGMNARGMNARGMNARGGGNSD